MAITEYHEPYTARLMSMNGEYRLIKYSTLGTDHAVGHIRRDFKTFCVSAVWIFTSCRKRTHFGLDADDGIVALTTNEGDEPMSRCRT